MRNAAAVPCFQCIVDADPVGVQSKSGREWPLAGLGAARASSERQRIPLNPREPELRPRGGLDPAVLAYANLCRESDVDERVRRLERHDERRLGLSADSQSRKLFP